MIDPIELKQALDGIELIGAEKRRFDRIIEIVAQSKKEEVLHNADYVEVRGYANQIIYDYFSRMNRGARREMDAPFISDIRSLLAKSLKTRLERIKDPNEWEIERLKRIERFKRFAEIIEAMKSESVKGRKPNPNAKPAYVPPLAEVSAIERLRSLLVEITDTVVPKMIEAEIRARENLIARYLDLRSSSSESPSDVKVNGHYWKSGSDIMGYVARKGGEWAIYEDAAERIKEDSVASAESVRAYFIGKMTKKAAYFLGKKTLLDLRTVSIEGSYPTFRCILHFKFADGSKFAMMNGIVWNKSARGREFQQYPTRFSSVFLSDGSEMKNPSEKSMKESF